MASIFIGKRVSSMADQRAMGEKESWPTHMSQLIRERRTIRSFAEHPLSQEIVIERLQAAAQSVFNEKGELPRMISRPIVAISLAAERIAQGDLTAEELRFKNQDEIGSLAASFNRMVDNLRDLVRQISISSEHVTMSSEELTASAGQSTQASFRTRMPLWTRD